VTRELHGEPPHRKIWTSTRPLPAIAHGSRRLA
jgi:hypothetical protein